MGDLERDGVAVATGSGILKSALAVGVLASELHRHQTIGLVELIPRCDKKVIWHELEVPCQRLGKRNYVNSPH